MSARRTGQGPPGPAHGRQPPRSVVLIAKEPAAGRVKTRLHAAVTPAQAAALAAASLQDTVEALLAVPAHRRVVALDGRRGPWLPDTFDVVPQPPGGLDVRLAQAFRDTLRTAADAPALLVGMDTPQLGPHLADVDFSGVDAVLGPTQDGGFWAIGLRVARPEVFLGVPMSTSGTGRAQLARLEALGLRVRMLPLLRDVDRPADAAAVAASAPRTRFAAAWREVTR